MADEARVKGHGLELHDDVAAQLQVVEEKIDVEVLIAHFQMDLAPHESEPRAQFQQEMLDVIHQGLLHLPLPARVSGPQEIEKVGILEDLGCHVGIRGRRGGRKVGDSLPLPFMGLVVQLEFQDASAPALGLSARGK